MILSGVVVVVSLILERHKVVGTEGPFVVHAARDHTSHLVIYAWGGLVCVRISVQGIGAPKFVCRSPVLMLTC